MQRPQADESGKYFFTYIDQVPDGDLLGIMEQQGRETAALLGELDEVVGEKRYEPGKWSTKELIGHVTDAERIFGYRALRIARGDEAPLPGFEQDDYVAAGKFGDRTLASLARELELLRAGHLELFQSFDAEVLARRGSASGSPFTVRALLYIITGHERHHVRVLRERYL